MDVPQNWHTLGPNVYQKWHALSQAEMRQGAGFRQVTESNKPNVVIYTYIRMLL